MIPIVPSNRRQFLAQVGRGMMLASLGSAMAHELGMTPLLANDEPARLTFGALDPLVDILQSTPIDRLMTLLVEKLRAGVPLRELTAAAALANARAFGGTDYIGFHTLMALGPALDMSAEFPAATSALPVLKVLYRNSAQIQKVGGLAAEALKPIAGGAAATALAANSADVLREAVHRGDRRQAELQLAAAVAESPERGWNDLLSVVHDATEVHRVVLVHRAWEMLAIVGQEHALSMLRQSLGYCLQNEPQSQQVFGRTREMLSRVMDQYKLRDCESGTRQADDAWVNQMLQTLFTSTPEQAADAVAAAIADGISPTSISEAVSLTANQLVLRDAGRQGPELPPEKPAGSVHGDSIGVHASDSAHAWRNIALHCNLTNRHAALVLAGYQVALDRTNRGGDFQNWRPRPWEEHLEQVQETDARALLSELQTAIEANDQEGACAVVAAYGRQGHAARNVLRLLAGYAVSQDGALHAEKYYRTTSDDFRSTRASLRWRHLVGLARVTASEFGREAPGYRDACELLAAQ